MIFDTPTNGFDVLVIILHIICGVIGNELRRDNLKRRGYECIETLQAETPDAAIASVVKSNET